MKPDFTIFIPVYNGEDFISECIQSALDQTVKNIEIVILNNSSHDRTKEIIHSFDDERIVTLNFSHTSKLGKSLNRAFAYDTKSKFFSILHSDDRLKKNFVKEMLDFEKKYPEYGILFCESSTIDFDGKKIKSLKNSFKRFFHLFFSSFEGIKGFFLISFWNHLIAPTAVFKNKEKTKYPLFGEDFTFFTDLYFWSNYLLRGNKVILLKKDLYLLRMHKKQESYDFKNFNNKKNEIDKLNKNLIKTFSKKRFVINIVKYSNYFFYFFSSFRL